MGSVFSKRKKKDKNKGNKITDQDRAVLDLKNARDRLHKYQKKLNIETEELQNRARKLVQEKKQDRAILLLKLKKYKEKQYQNVDGQLLTIMELIETIEWETQQLKVFDALKEGNQALKKLNEEMPLEEVEKLMEDTQEAIEYQEELSQLLSGGLADGDVDEEELGQELLELEEALHKEEAGADVARKRKENASPARNLEAELPEAPTHVPVNSNSLEQQEEPQQRTAVLA